MDINASPVVLTTPDGDIELAPTASGRTRITLKPRDPNLYIPRRTCETSHPGEVELFLKGVSSFAWLCDAVSRHEEPNEVQDVLQRQLFAYVEPRAYWGARMLDFGCGGGASTFAMAAFLPETEIIGLELDPLRVELCQKIAARRGTSKVRFFVSPSGDSVPSQIGSFDFIMFSAVYEHLLPHERQALMPRLWALLRPGGVLFINQTPHRWVPYEHHSTELWGINYLPDSLAHWYVRNFSRVNPAINRSTDWNTHLRGGLRGGTERGIIADLTAASQTRGVILQPATAGLATVLTTRLAGTSPQFRSEKRGIASVFRFAIGCLIRFPLLTSMLQFNKELLNAPISRQG